MASCNVQILPSKDDAGQATVEFALLLPLYVACIALLISSTAIGLTSVRLADTARTAARVASTAENPRSAVDSYISGPGINDDVSFDESQTFLTVHLTKKIRIPIVGLALPIVKLTAQSTVLYEGIPALLK